MKTLEYGTRIKVVRGIDKDGERFIGKTGITVDPHDKGRFADNEMVVVYIDGMSGALGFYPEELAVI